MLVTILVSSPRFLALVVPSPSVYLPPLGFTDILLLQPSYLHYIYWAHRATSFLSLLTVLWYCALRIRENDSGWG